MTRPIMLHRQGILQSAGAAGGGIALGNQATVLASGTNASDYESNTLSLSGGTDVIVVALIEFLDNKDHTTGDITSLTYGTAGRALGTGTAMDVRVDFAAGTGTENVDPTPGVIIATLTAPGADGTVLFETET